MDWSRILEPILCLFVFLLVMAYTWTANAVDISNKPMETIIQAAPPNIMYVYDNSGSMDWEFMTEEHDGLFCNGEPDWWDCALYIFRDEDYDPDPDHNYTWGNNLFENDWERMWKSQWNGYNKIYYNPNMTYNPWPNMQNADIVTPRSNPFRSSPVFHLNHVFLQMHQGEDGGDDFGDTWQDAYQINCSDVIRGDLEQAYDHDVFKIVLNNDGNLTVWTTMTSECTDVMGRILDSSGNEYRNTEWADDWSDPYNGDNNFYDDDCRDAAWCDFSCDSSYDRDFYITLNNVPAGTYYIDVRGYAQATGTYDLHVSFSGNCQEPPQSGELTKLNIYNAHYYAFADKDGDGIIDPGEVYLVNFEDTDDDGILDTRKYYDYNSTNEEISLSAFVPVAEADVPSEIRAKKYDDDGNVTGYMTFDEELQNFANWFSYYRRRELTAKAAVGASIAQFTGVNIGLYTINAGDGSHNGARQPVLSVDNHETDLLNKLYDIDSYSGTPLRTSLLEIGKYYNASESSSLGSAPWATAEDGGACQQAFTILMTDGFWNGDSPGVGNVDGDDGIPFADSYSNTLADVARKYYDTDLNHSLDNIVPTNACDENTRQHMVTYSLSFGVKGVLDPSYDAYNPCLLGVINHVPGAPPAPNWQNPTSSDGAKIDDLWHAAVNGRGAFYSAANPQELIDALNAITESISGRLASGAAVAINSEKLTTGSVLYQSTYNSSNWTGDLKAFSMNVETGEVGDPIWQAKEILLNQDWDTGRRIITSHGTSGSGVAFRLNQLTNTQKNMLGNTAEEQENVVEFVRGKEISGFRIRPKIDDKVDKLGDLVHSAPTLVGNTIYVGGNDGMLHAFNADTGNERFAFVPYSVFTNLKDLTSPSYSHKFYVDLTPTVKEKVDDGNGSERTILVGGLGAGGKGYYALDITNADTLSDNSSETDVVSNIPVLWEYPGTATDNDLGSATLSKVSLIKAHNGSYVAIFGNGYNSVNGHAVLYALDLLTGQVLAKIDTGAGNDNGLSTPAVVDVDGDFVADYVYAGDLKGNMWKFDITDASPSNWHVAFSEAGVKKPLFQAIGQPITVKPDIMRHCEAHGYMVVFATGKFMGQSDETDTSQQTVYGIWDYGDSDQPQEYVGSFDVSSHTFTPSPELNGNNVTMLQQSITTITGPNGVEYRLVSDNETYWNTKPDDVVGHLPDPYGTPVKSHVGWYMDLGGNGFEGERAVRDVIIRNGNAIVITVIPNESPCSGGGRSVIYEVDACDGSRPHDPVFDVNGDAMIDENDLLSPNDQSGGQPPAGRVFDTIVHDPVFVEIGDSTMANGQQQEFKYFSTAQGTIVRLREPGDFLGIYYWIEW